MDQALEPEKFRLNVGTGIARVLGYRVSGKHYGHYPLSPAWSKYYVMSTFHSHFSLFKKLTV